MIVISVQSMAGETQQIKVWPTDQIRRMIHQYFSEEESNFHIRFIYKGQVLNDELSFGYYSIQDGDRIIVFLKKKNQPTENHTPKPRKPISMKKIEIMERIKSEDRFFSFYESSKVLPKVLKESMKIIEQREIATQEHHETIIPQNTILSTSRLPFFDNSSIPPANISGR